MPELDQDVYTDLCEKFDHVYQQTRGGKEFDYITIEQCVSRLNEVLGIGNWEFTVLEHGTDEKGVWVLGRLIIDTGEGLCVRRDQFGECATHTGMSTGDARKGAASDALKKAASLIGVGLYLSDKEEQATAHAQGQAPARNDGSKAAPTVQVSSDPWSLFWGRARAVGWTPETVSERLGGMGPAAYAKTKGIGPDEVWVLLQPEQAG